MQQQQQQQPPLLVDLLDPTNDDVGAMLNPSSTSSFDQPQEQQQQSGLPSLSLNEFSKINQPRTASPLRIATTTTSNMVGGDDTPPSSTSPSPFDSPEPFSHPSSPICNDSSSLTHENLHLLDHSLTLTEHDGHDDSEAIITTGDATSYETILGSSSYVSFPSLSTSRSRANSIVSSAIMSTSTAIANNTSGGNVISSRRRRPRPWDNFNAKHDQERKDVETTPLLHSKQVKASIHSVKTAKRGNAGGYQGRKRILRENYEEKDDLSSYEKVQIQDGSPSLEWKEGVFTDHHYGSIHGHGDRQRNVGVSMGISSQGAFHLLDASSACADAPFMMMILSLTVLQFVLMALYNIFLHYHSHRLNHQPPYAFWFSGAGRIYNSGFGPNVPTLIMFGVFHPFLVTTEWWRMATGMVCCTSLIEFVLNVFWLRILMGVEEDKRNHGRKGRSGMVWGFVFVVCGVMGALAHMIVSNGEDEVFVTGLNSAGIVGCMAAKGVMDGWHFKSNKGYDGIWTGKKEKAVFRLWSIGVGTCCYNVRVAVWNIFAIYKLGKYCVWRLDGCMLWDAPFEPKAGLG